MQFSQLELSQSLQKALQTMKYETLTMIQEAVIPSMLTKEDLIVRSMTGSGKTLAYALPILQQISFDIQTPQALVIVPTRELAQQVTRTFDSLGINLHTHHQMLVGKQSFHFQREDLKQRTHVVIATPGRLLQHIHEQTIDLSKLSMLVLDEGDEMFHLGFRQTLEKILDHLPHERQTCCFSATFPSDVHQFMDANFPHARWIEQDQDEMPDQLTQQFFLIEKEHRFAFLIDLLQTYPIKRCIVFVNTIELAQQLTKQLQAMQLLTSALHGKQTQEERFASLQEFRDGKTRILVSSNVAARGLDIDDVSLIVNYDFPLTLQAYIHRVGRTARMHKDGSAISLIDSKQMAIFQQLCQRDPSCIIESPVCTKAYPLDALRKPLEKKLQREDLAYQQVTKLCIFAGKSKKIRPGDLVGAICSIEGITNEDIGVIKIQEHQSYVDILNEKGMIVLEQLNRRTIKNKRIRVEIANKK